MLVKKFLLRCIAILGREKGSENQHFQSTLLLVGTVKCLIAVQCGIIV